MVEAKDQYRAVLCVTIAIDLEACYGQISACDVTGQQLQLNIRSMYRQDVIGSRLVNRSAQIEEV